MLCRQQTCRGTKTCRKDCEERAEDWLPINEDVIYQDKNKTPEQSSLLERPNFAQYPTEQELSGNEVTQSSSGTQESGAENDEAASEEYIGQVLTSLAGAYDSLANEAQKDVTNNLDSFKAEAAARSDEEIASAIADIESTPDLVELFEHTRNGLLSGEIKRTKQEEQELINALQE